MHRARAFFFVCAGIFLLTVVGCAASVYSQYFTSTIPASQRAETNSTTIPYVGEPEVRSGEDPKEDYITMLENGYALVGYSNFNGPPADPAGARTQARALHAAVALLYYKNPQTVTETGPVVDLLTISSAMASNMGDVLNPKTETTKTSGTIYGGGGSVDYSGTSTRTVAGEKAAPQAPQMRTYTSTRYDQFAAFWVKTKPPRLGAIYRDLTPDERAARGTNKGVRVDGVIMGSPAFVADVFRGDILTKVGDVRIFQEEDMYSALDRYAGTEVDLVIERGKVEKTIRVRLNPTPK